MREQPNTSLPRIGIDLMGSDTSPEELLRAVLALSSSLKASAQLVVLATPDNCISSPEISLIPVHDVIHMHDDPLLAVRRKKEASLCIGMRLLKEKKLDAFITSGNTGALIACAKLFLPMIKGIKRPALMTLLPTLTSPLAVLDVGANVVCTSEHLVQFAHLGIAYQKSRGIEEPRVALLNNGTEKGKGTPELKKAYQKLQGLKNFAGNIEGRDIFSGKIDVLVTDGFTGNVFLKTVEGVGSYLLSLLEQNDIQPVLKLRSHLNYAEYPGAILAGVKGIALKCHGNAAPEALQETIKAALSLITHRFLDKI